MTPDTPKNISKAELFRQAKADVKAKEAELMGKKSASPKFLPAAEPMSTATDAIDAQIRRKGRRRQVGKSQGQEPKLEPTPEPKAGPTAEELEKERERELEQKKQAFMESVSDGRAVVFVNKESGVRKIYHWDGSDFIVGKTAKGRVATSDVWERYQDKDNWTWEVAPAEKGLLPGDPAGDAAVALRDMERDLLEKEKKEDDKGVPTLQATEEKEEDYAKGDVFAKQYLDLNPPHETEKATVEPEESPAAAGENKAETLDQKVAHLKNEVEDLRKDYVKADYNETNAWARMKKFFGKSRMKGTKEEKEKAWQIKRYGDVKNENSSEEEIKYQDGAYWQAEYQNKLFDLKNAQLALIKERAVTGDGWKQEMGDMVKYFGEDEVSNLINARTQYRAENQNWPTKVFDSFNALGREYNKLSKKDKLYIVAACVVGAGALALSGGTAAGAVAGLIVGGRKVLASAGLAVGTEALLDSYQTKRRSKVTEKFLATLEAETSEKGLADLYAKLEARVGKQTMTIDDELQKAKLTKLLNKAGALTAGIAVSFGSGWLTQIAMDKWGGSELVGRVKDSLGNIFGEATVAHSNIPAPGVPDTGTGIGRGIGVPSENVPGGSGMVYPNVQVPEEGWSVPPESAHGGMPEESPGTVPPIVPGVEAGIIKPDFINEFINQEIIVQKGDSVWKIAGRLADQLGLEDSQKTHFIDAMKDRYGDVLLKEGETINFSAHGIDREFVDNALQQAKDLTSEQMNSIEANDAKIAEFAATNPHITLTNESVDDILHGNVVDAASGEPTVVMGVQELGDASSGPGGADAILQGADVRDTLTDSVPDASDGETTTVADTNKSPLKTADINYDRDIVLGAKYDVAAYKEFFRLSPEAFTQFKKIGETYMEVIFQGDQKAMDTIGGKIIGEIKNFPNEPPSKKFVESFGKFVKLAQGTYGSKFGLPNPKEQVYAYIARMVMLGMEYPGAKRIILPQYF